MAIINKSFSKSIPLLQNIHAITSLRYVSYRNCCIGNVSYRGEVFFLIVPILIFYPLPTQDDRNFPYYLKKTNNSRKNIVAEGGRELKQ